MAVNATHASMCKLCCNSACQQVLTQLPGSGPHPLVLWRTHAACAITTYAAGPLVAHPNTHLALLELPAMLAGPGGAPVAPCRPKPTKPPAGLLLTGAPLAPAAAGQPAAAWLARGACSLARGAGGATAAGGGASAPARGSEGTVSPVPLTSGVGAVPVDSCW